MSVDAAPNTGVLPHAAVEARLVHVSGKASKEVQHAAKLQDLHAFQRREHGPGARIGERHRDVQLRRCTCTTWAGLPVRTNVDKYPRLEHALRSGSQQPLVSCAKRVRLSMRALGMRGLSSRLYSRNSMSGPASASGSGLAHTSGSKT